jgi:hypothetical protein
MTQTAFDFERGLELRDAGCAATLAHAERDTPDWLACALSILRSFAKDRVEFTSDDFRAFARGILPDPPHHNAFGALFNNAAKAGVIQRVGYARARRDVAHGRVLGVWAAA